VDDAAEYGTSRAANSEVYFGVGLINGSPAGRGKSDDVSAIGALWADIDIHSSFHVSNRLPGSLDDARDLLSQLPLRPSVLVRTGHGLHAYWLLHEPWIFESPDDRDQAAQLTKSWHGLVCAAASRKGWSLENLGDLTRVLRATPRHDQPSRSQSTSAS
jgi:putative DNA primase/helicase